jgi:hypothetical protein
MNLFFYLPGSRGKGEDVLGAVAPFACGGSLEVFPDLRSFAARMRRPKDSLSVALIWNPTKEDLRAIGSMRDLLTGVRTLLILPDQETETIALAHKIFPTYITYVDEGASKIVSVLERLTRTGRDVPEGGARR